MTVKEAFFKLLRISLGNENELSLPNDVPITDIMDLSDLTGLSGLAILGYQKLIDGGFDVIPANKVEKQRLLQWLGFSMMLEQKSFIQWKAIKQLVDRFAHHGIITVGLKGLTVAQWYPNPKLRNSCDFDCFLIKENIDGSKFFAYEEGNRVIEMEGVQVDRRIYVHSVFDYHGLIVENHHYLSAIKLGKRQKRLDSLLKSLLLEEPLRPVMGTELMMGSPMFTAIFLTHHAHRHFLNESLPLKLLTDWALFVKNNMSLNWKVYEKYVDEFGMLRFAQTMTRLAVNLLGSPKPFAIPDDPEADELIEDSLWATPEVSKVSRTMISRRLKQMKNIMTSRNKYKVFYDSSSFTMIVSYIKGYLFEKE